MRLGYLLLLLPFVGIQNIWGQITFDDACFTSFPAGTTFETNQYLSGLNADLLEWTGTAWVGGFINAEIDLPAPTNSEGCRAIWVGDANSWTGGGEGFYIKMTSGLIVGQNYDLTLTYASEGLYSDGQFALIIGSATAPGIGDFGIGTMPTVGYNWETHTLSFVATAAQAGHTWLSIHNGADGTSGIVNSFCSGCNTNLPLSCSVAAGNDVSVCGNVGVTLTATAAGAFTYSWWPTVGLSDANISNPIASPTVSTDYVVTAQILGGNLVNNGNFAFGNTAFTSDYTFTPPPNLTEGQYYVSNAPQSWNGGFSACDDHSSTTDGQMMLVNGSPVPNQAIWCQTVTVEPNTDYVFSTWLTSLFAGPLVQLQCSINGNIVGDIFEASADECTWNQFFEIWNSGIATTALLCINNQNTAIQANDFALDDISFAKLCIATDTVRVNVGQPTQSAISATICTGESYPFDGNQITTTGQYTATLGNSVGCDSTISLQLTVLPNPETTITANICQNQTYIFDGQQLTQAGTYTQILTTSNGCDSTTTLLLAVWPTSFNNNTITLCNGDSIAVGNNFYHTSGTYLDTLPTALGCDSIISINLTVIDGYEVTNIQSICADQSIQVGEKFYFLAGNYTDTLTSSIGCDSIVNTQLTVFPLYKTTQEYSLCEGDTLWLDFAASFTGPGIYYDTLSSIHGCDSILTTRIRNADPLDCEYYHSPIFIPNVFTPNGDNQNDLFQVFPGAGVTVHLLRMYDRWGELVFESTDPNPVWDGTFRRQTAPAGVYVYYLELTGTNRKKYTKKGNITIIR